MTVVTWPQSQTRGICKTKQIGEDWLPVALLFSAFPWRPLESERQLWHSCVVHRAPDREDGLLRWLTHRLFFSWKTDCSLEDLVIWMCTLLLHLPVPECAGLINPRKRVRAGAGLEFRSPDCRYVSYRSLLDNHAPSFLLSKMGIKTILPFSLGFWKDPVTMHVLHFPQSLTYCKDSSDVSYSRMLMN